MSPGRADAEVVSLHLAALRQAAAALRRHAGTSAAAFRADIERRWVVQRGLHICAQNVLDIAKHLAAAAGQAPQGYAEAIDCLGASGILPRAFANRFRGVAGFRNVLAHNSVDIDIDLDRVARFLSENLDDFEEFARHIERRDGA